MYEAFNFKNRKTTKSESTQFDNNDCIKIKSQYSKKNDLEICKNSIPNHMLLNSNNEKFVSIKSLSNDILINTGNYKFDIFNVDISLQDAIEIKTPNYLQENFSITLHHKQKTPIYLSFDLPIVVFKPENQYYKSTYSILCYTSKGFFGVYPFNLNDLTDRSNLSKKDCEKGKLPCAFDIKINDIKIPPDEDIQLDMYLIESTNSSNLVCSKFINNNSKEATINYKSNPVYMIMKNFKFRN